MIRSNILLSTAARIDQVTIGMPFTNARFFFGMRFDPARAGMIAMVLIIVFQACFLAIERHDPHQTFPELDKAAEKGIGRSNVAPRVNLDGSGTALDNRAGRELGRNEPEFRFYRL